VPIGSQLSYDATLNALVGDNIHADCEATGYTTSARSERAANSKAAEIASDVSRG